MTLYVSDGVEGSDLIPWLDEEDLRGEPVQEGDHA